MTKKRFSYNSYVQLKQYWRWLILGNTSQGKKHPFCYCPNWDPPPAQIDFDTFFKSKKVAQTTCRREVICTMPKRKGIFFSEVFPKKQLLFTRPQLFVFRCSSQHEVSSRLNKLDSLCGRLCLKLNGKSFPLAFQSL